MPIDKGKTPTTFVRCINSMTNSRHVTTRADLNDMKGYEEIIICTVNCLDTMQSFKDCSKHDDLL